MNPPLAMPRRPPGNAESLPPDRRRDPPRVRRFGLALFATSVSAAVVLVLTGQPLPAPGFAVALVAVLACSVNRYTFFPSELAITAEVAVVIAAVVAFSDDAPLLGPVLIALAVGPVDMVHWEQRAFTRMAHNAGDRALAAVVAAVAYAGVTGDSHASVPRVAAGVLAATLAFAAVEVLASVVLLRLLGERGWRATVGHAIGLEALTVPLGIVGGVAGALALAHHPWFGLAVLAPLPWVPELAHGHRAARARVPRGAVARAAAGTMVVALTAVVVALSPPGQRVPVLVLCAGSIALGYELLATRDQPVPPLAVLAVLPVVPAPSGRSTIDGLVRAGSLAAVVVCAGAVAGARAGRAAAGPGARGHPWRVPVAAGVAAAGGVAAAALGAAWAPSGDVAVLWCTIAAAAAFLSVVTSCSADPVRGAARLVWLVPVIAGAALVASVTPGPSLGYVPAAALALGAVARTTAPPWRSRRLARAGRGVGSRGVVLAVVLVLVASALTLATTALVGGSANATVWWSAAAAELLLAIGLAATRQWRFAPVARRRGTVAGVAAALALVALYVPLATSASGWSLFVLIASLACASYLVAPLVRIAAHARTRGRSRPPPRRHYIRRA